MKNPLTSKERRGLTAVAAAALLCISSGFIFRSCSSCGRICNDSSPIVVTNNDSICGDNGENSADSTLLSKRDNKRNNKNNKSKDKRKKRNSSQKNKAERVYPTRDPLSQPCD